MADYDEMSSLQRSLQPVGRSIKAAEEEQAAEFQRVLSYRSYPLSGVVLREPADVHHSHHVQQVSLVRRTGKIFFFFYFSLLHGDMIKVCLGCRVKAFSRKKESMAEK